MTPQISQRRGRVLALIFAVVAMTLLLSGCRGKTGTKVSSKKSPTAKTSASASAAAIDPCVVVTKQDAEQLAGTPLNDATPVKQTCTYSGPTDGPTAQVEIFVGDGAKKFYEIDKDSLGHPFRTLSGIGDEAYSEDYAVFFNKGGTWVSIHLVRLEDPKQYDKPLEDLARKVVERI